MNDDEIKSIKENLKNVEFNNEDEDNEIINEEKKAKKEPNKNDDDMKNKIIIGCCVVIGILLLIIILFIAGVFNKSESEEGSTKEPDSENVTPIDNEKPKEKLEVSTLSSYFLTDNYLYVKKDNNKYITDLEGNVLLELNKDAQYIKGKTNYILTKETSGDKTKYTIQKVDEERVIDVIKQEVSNKNGLIYDENNNLLGIYETNSKNETLYLIDNHVSREIKYNNQELKTAASYENKIIYGGRYGIIYKNSSYGLYDTKDNKSLIEPKYQSITFLHDDIFAATKNGKVGIIDKNDKVLLDFEYDAIDYENNIYFVKQNGIYHIYNKNYEDTNNTIDINENAYELITFKENVVVKKNGNDEYAVVDKTGIATDYDFNSVVVYGNYLVTGKKNSTVVTTYDPSLKKVQDYNTKRNNNDLNSAAVFLNYFMINGRQLFELNSGTYKFEVNNLSRSYQGYMIYLNFVDDKVNVSVKLEDNEIGTIDNVNVIKFLKTENNGIKVTKDYFIFSVDDKNLIIKK